ncbi:MAG: CRISPR-associated protein [Cyanophyceae cyanobacterium]
MIQRNPVIEAIADPTKRFLNSFVISILLLTLIADGFSSLFWDYFADWIGKQLGISSVALFKLVVWSVITTILFILISLTPLSRWLRDKFIGAFGAASPQPNVYPLEKNFTGLIVAMSPKNDSPAERAIMEHWDKGKGQLEHCWIICTEKSLPFAKNMLNNLTKEGVTQKVKIYYGNYELEDLDFPGEKLSLLVPDDRLDDPNHIHHLVNCIYNHARNQRLDEFKVIADITGATKVMTAGIILACATPRRHLQYISQIHFPQIMEVKITYNLKHQKFA